MRLKLYYLLIAVLGLVTFAGCNDDDENLAPRPNAPEAVLNAFNAKYPDAKDVKWETKGAYYVADFKTTASLVEIDAWYKADGTWAMTESDYGKDLFMVPTAINQAFNASQYATWTIDDISYYEYPDATKSFYLIEVEKVGQTDMQLYFKPDGTSIKNVADNGVDITPDTVI